MQHKPEPEISISGQEFKPLATGRKHRRPRGDMGLTKPGAFRHTESEASGLKTHCKHPPGSTQKRQRADSSLHLDRHYPYSKKTVSEHKLWGVYITPPNGGFIGQHETQLWGNNILLLSEHHPSEPTGRSAYSYVIRHTP